MASTKRKSDVTQLAERLSKKSKAYSSTAPNIFPIQEEESAFPRGGGSVLTPLEHRKIQIKAKQDVLFEEKTGKKSVPPFDSEDEENEGIQRDAQSTLGATRRKQAVLPKKRSVKKSQAEASGPRIEGLSYKRIVPGSLVLGQVSQINSYDVNLSLPNNLTGYVPLVSISDTITRQAETLAEEESASEGGKESEDSHEINLESLFWIGQYLRAYVVSTNDTDSLDGKSKKRIELSIKPQQANGTLSSIDMVVGNTVQAEVLSVEDHGIIMNLGLEDRGIRGFISSKELGPSKAITEIQQGAVMLCLVTGLSSNGKILKLSADPQRLGSIKKANYVQDAPSVDSILPGTVVEFLISEVKSSGIAGKFMGVLDVTADVVHSGAAASIKPLEKRYHPGSKTKGRVLCTFPGATKKKLGLSLLDHVVRLSTSKLENLDGGLTPTELLPLSTVLEQVKVIHVEPALGLFVDVGIKGTQGFVHISRLSDEKIEALSESTGPYKSGTVHRGRVVGFNLMDGLFIVSFEKEVLDSPFLRLEDVQVGQIVEGVVERLVTNERGVLGVLIKLTDTITGMVPEMHLADVHLQHPEKKFKEGFPTKARVLSIDLERRQLRLTLKKSLVNSDGAVWQSYNSLSIGMQSPGTLVKILSAGAVVQFYGSVRGFLPISQMSETYIHDPQQHFRVGQVVNVTIISIDATEQRMTVSCRDPTTLGPEHERALLGITIGSSVKGAVSEKTSDKLIIELESSGLKGSLLVDHLTDGSASKCLSAAKRIRVGQILQDIIILSKDDSHKLVKLTSKPSLIKAAKNGTLLKTFDEITVGMEVVGFVKNITPSGVFIEFGDGLTGLLLKKHVVTANVDLPDFGLRTNESIATRVLSLDHNMRKFNLTQDVTSTLKTKKTISVAESNNSSRTLSNAIDGMSMSMDDYSFGTRTKAEIISVRETQLNVRLADGIQGRIDVSQIFDAWEDIMDPKKPLNSFTSTGVLAVRILGVHNSRNHRFLPITHSAKAPVYELTAKPSDLTEKPLDILTIQKVEVGSIWLVYINNIAEDCIWVNLSPNVRGRIRILDISEDVSMLSDIEKNFPIGSALKAKVLSVDTSQNHLDMSACIGDHPTPSTLKDLNLGMVLAGIVTKVTERQVMVQLNEALSAPVNLINLADDYALALPTLHRKHQIVRVCVTETDLPNGRFTLSMRPSRILSSSLPVKDVELTSITQVKANDVVRGFVRRIADNGVSVTISSNITAFVRITDLSDSYIKDWKSIVEVDQLVQGKILSADPVTGYVRMSLKNSILDTEYKPPLTYADLQVGQIVTGKVRKVEDFGVFIVLDNSANVSGLCHRSEMSEELVADVKKLYEEGDAVKAKILKVELEKRRLSLGLKASYLENSREELDSDDDSENMSDVLPRSGNTSDSIEEDAEEEKGLDMDVDNVQDMESLAETRFGHNPYAIEPVSPINSSGVKALSVGEFDWTGGIAKPFLSRERSDTDSETELPRKKKHRRADIKVDRTGDLDANGPQSGADFERLLMGQPNSSYLWLSYMAFQLQLGEVDKARDIAERAIRSINTQSKEFEDDTLNVWVAFLNLENTFGSDESIEEVFKRACDCNDPEELHSRLVSIYIQSGKTEKADALLQNMIKKFSQDPKVWHNYATFLFDTLNAPPRARDLLPRALQSLPSYHQFDLTSKFAQLEFKSTNGDPERGRTIFEGLLSTFPKRLDLWNVLLDLEIKKGDKEMVRQLFGRITSRNLKPKKAKFFFKRWLDFEETVGDVKSQEMVKARAAEFVRKVTKQ